MLRSTVTISSKRQLTIPASFFRHLGLKEGQKMIIELEDDKMIITSRPESLTKALAGSMRGLYGENASEIDDYIRKEREEWQK